MAGSGSRETTLKLSLAGGAKVKLVRLDAHEGLSEAFHFTLDIESDAAFEILPNLGKPASVECKLEGEFVRYFHGIVVAGEFIEKLDTDIFSYRLMLAPSANFHEHGSNFRIFQQMSTMDIVKKVLEENKIAFQFKSSTGTTKRDYCVQYGESDFAFVCRLMEEIGLYYFYQHKADSHVLTICDAPGCHENYPQTNITYNPIAASLAMRDSQAREYTPIGVYVDRWSERVTSGAENRVTMRDYEFIDSVKAREAVHKDKSAHDDDTIEVYQWPGRFYDYPENYKFDTREPEKSPDKVPDRTGTELSTILLEARRAQRVTFEGSGYYPGLLPGYKFALKKHPVQRYNANYLIVRSHTYLASEQYRSGAADDETTVSFTAIPALTRFHAPMVTPRPFVRGPETAVVTGPANEEIYVDKYGRVKVQFHWDREGKLDDKSSCWIRVSQTGGLGNNIIPRVGHEVIVDFVNGNPDRPIIVGRVFNSQHMPVYNLPEHKTKALWRTKTYMSNSSQRWDGAKQFPEKANEAKSTYPKAQKGSGTEKEDHGNANEIRLDDATDSPEFFVHAEKDLNTRIRNDETRKVGRNVEIWVGGDRIEEVDQNEQVTIGVDRTEVVGGEEKVGITGNREVTIMKNDTLKVTQEIHAKAGTTILVEAQQKITFKCGQSEIEMTPTGITISTVMLDMSAQAKSKLNAPVNNVEASGILTAKGGLVLIN